MKENTEKLVSDFKEHPKLAALPYQKVLSDAENAKGNVEQFIKEVDEVSLPWDCKAAVARMRDSLGCLQKTMNEVRRYRDGLGVLQAENRLQQLEKRRGWRTKRDVYVKVFRDKGLPQCLAKSFADACQMWVSTQGEEQRTEQRTLTEALLQEPDKFKKPFLIPDGDSLHLCKEAKLFLAENEEKINEGMKKVKSDLKANGKAQAFTTFKSERDFVWKDPAVTSDMDFNISPLKSLIFVAEDATFANGARAVPYGGARAIISAADGSLLVGILPSKVLLTHLDLPVWLKGAKAEDLSDLEVFVVQKGESVWVPFGTYPLVTGAMDLDELKNWNKVGRGKVGKAAQAKQKEAKTHISWVVTPALDKEVDSKENHEIVAHVLTRWMSAHSALPSSYNSDPGAIEWKQALEAQSKAGPSGQQD